MNTVSDNPLTFTVIAAVVSTCGTLLALFLKDFLLVNYFNDLKEKKELERISKKYKDPILLSATELVRRISEFKTRYKKVALRYTKVNLFNKVDYLQANKSDDPYYIKYRIISTIYRFCAFFGWLEIYRQDITFLDSHSKNERFKSLEIIEKIREEIADGQKNNEEGYSDVLIFRDELRAVGEGMIEVINGQKSIIGYGKFLSLIVEFETDNKYIWLRPVINFFTEFKSEKDFRVKRFENLSSNLKELIYCLDSEYYNMRVKDRIS
ncbi:hypothetical protein ACW9KT_19760 [Hymenobacter sp. HD11105]